jgi:hypothetical protein
LDALQSVPPTVEISGYSHFFGFEHIHWMALPLRILRETSKKAVGMAFAKRAPDDASLKAARFGILAVLPI